MSNSNLLVVKEKVQRFSKQLFEKIELTDNGALSIPYESTHVFVEVYEHELDEESREFRKSNDLSSIFVLVWAMVLTELKGSMELFKWVATVNFDVVRFKLVEREDRLYNLVCEYHLAGEALDAGELKSALAAVAIISNDEDDKLKSQFGGKTAEDYRK